jgi:hypothetical protein
MKSWRDFISEEMLSKMTWEKPCDNMFSFLLKEKPEDLLNLVKSKILNSADLTFAAEMLGNSNIPGVEEALVELLDHASVVVREGAIYGLTACKELSREALNRLSKVKEWDSNATIRSVAGTALEEIAGR